MAGGTPAFPALRVLGARASRSHGVRNTLFGGSASRHARKKPTPLRPQGGGRQLPFFVNSGSAIVIPIARPKFTNRTANPPTPPVSNPNPLNAPSHHATHPTHPPPPPASPPTPHPPHPLHNDPPHTTHAPLGSTQTSTQANTPTPPPPPASHAPDANPRSPTPLPLPPTHATRTTPPLPPPSPSAPTNANTPHPTTGQRLPASAATLYKRSTR
jgi:hypothetical protein